MIEWIIGGIAGIYGLCKLCGNSKDNGERTSHPTRGSRQPHRPGTRVAAGSKQHQNMSTHNFSKRNTRHPSRENNWAYEFDSNLRVFYIEGTEAHSHTIDTSDPNSPFYGPAWTSILGAYDEKGVIRGRLLRKNYSNSGEFSGYDIDVAGIHAFLPRSRSGWFYNCPTDPAGKCVAISVEKIETLGRNAGSVNVNAVEPLKVAQREIDRRTLCAGNELEALAVDHDGRNLIFPLDRDGSAIRVPLNQALTVAQKAGCPNDPGLLTGHVWKIKIGSRHDNNLNAVAVMVYK